MKKVTIIVNDSFVSIDGIGYHQVDLSSIPDGIHAVQWADGQGWIEFCEDADGKRPNNQDITSLENFNEVLSNWEVLEHKNKTATLEEPGGSTVDDNYHQARLRLSLTDWSQLPDVNISNKEEFVLYRALMRSYVFNTPSGVIDWPTEPQPVWVITSK